VSPSSGTAVRWGTPIVLSGVGWDAEDGLLAPAALSFRSSTDGPLGVGTAVEAWLSPGPHTLVLEGRDADGHVAEAAIEVTVGYEEEVPILERIEPNAGLAGAIVELTGSNFDVSATTVRFDNLQAEVIDVTSTRCLARVPSGLPIGTVEVTMGVRGLLTYPLPFRVEGPPRLLARPGASGIELLWPEAFAGFALEVSNVTGPVPMWGPAEAVPLLVDGQWVVEVSPSGTAQFFRLVWKP